MSEIHFECTACGQKLSIDQEYAGQTTECPSCQTSLIIPSQATPLSAPSLSAAASSDSPNREFTDQGREEAQDRQEVEGLLSPRQFQELFRRCKPLSDPVRFFSRVVVPILVLVACLYSGLKASSNYMSMERYPKNGEAPAGERKPSTSLLEEFVLPFGVFFLLGSLLPLSLRLLLREPPGAPVLLLRAFSSDRSSGRMRQWLKAALGMRQRLCGIRPPVRRSTLFARLVSWPWLVLRYAGSSYFELEAGDRNWLARLLATIKRSSFMIIDIRTVTTFVEDEISISVLNGGLERCVFIVDETRALEEWASELASRFGCPEGTSFRMILWSERWDLRSFVAHVRKQVAGISREPMGLSLTALDYLRQKVAPGHWQTRAWETDAGLFIGSLLMGLMVLVVPATFLQQIETQTWMKVGLFLVAMFAAAYAAAFTRAWEQADIDAKVRLAGEKAGLGRVFLSGFLALIFLAVTSLALIWLSKVSR